MTLRVLEVDHQKRPEITLGRILSGAGGVSIHQEVSKELGHAVALQ